MNKTLRVTIPWFLWMTSCFHFHEILSEESAYPGIRWPPGKENSDFLWPRTKHFVETFILKLPWNAFRWNPSDQQFDGSSERKANLIYLKSNLMIGIPVENSVFTKISLEEISLSPGNKLLLKNEINFSKHPVLVLCFTINTL